MTMAPHTTTSHTTWLVRTLGQKMLGPITREQVSQWILSGRISLQDEVCPANGYWFFVHEREEVKRWLGIELPRLQNLSRDQDAFGTEEITETEPGVAKPVLRQTEIAHLGREMQAPESTQMLVRPPTGTTPPLGTQAAGGPTASPVAHGAGASQGARPPQARFFSQVGWLFLFGVLGLIVVIWRLIRLD